MYCQGRNDHGLHRHGGWLHFVGELEAEIDATERIGECFLFWLIRHTALLPAAFRRQPVVQLEFVKLRVPCVLDEPQPE